MSVNGTAKSAAGTTPDRVTTDGHGSYPRSEQLALLRAQHLIWRES